MSKKMTPCEELGYKVGDEFEVISHHAFKKGQIVTLHKDDGTKCPLFAGDGGGAGLIDGVECSYAKLSKEVKLIAKKLNPAKQALADAIHQNGGWVEGGEFAAQDKDGGEGCAVWFYSGGMPYRHQDFWYPSGNGEAIYGKHISCGTPFVNWHQTILSREEYCQAYPKADADGWIEWTLDELPVEKGTIIDVKYSDGDELHGAPCGEFAAGLVSIRGEPARAEQFGLFDDGVASIIAYRLHKPDVKPEFCESVMRSIPEPESIDGLCAKVTEENKHQHVDAKPTIEQLAQDYRNKLDFAKRKQDEADKANMESDAALSQLEDAIAAIGFVITPLAATVKEPELVAAVKVGDQVECVESNINRDKYNGMVGRLHFIDESDTSAPYLVDFGGKAEIWCHEVKFIRRP